MQSMIDAHNLPFGETSEGKAWCLKALNPASPIVECRGLPDESAVPSAHFNYQSVVTIGNPNPAAIGTWSFVASLLPHPINFLYHRETDSVGSLTGNVLNTQITGATHTLKYQAFNDFAERWRLTYMSVTVYQDGPALADQGVLAACQVPCKATPFAAGALNAGGTAYQSLARVCAHNTSDNPDFTKMQNMPNAYMGKSRDGLYSPLKLTRSCQQWSSQADASMYSTYTLAAPYTGVVSLATGAALTAIFPHPDLTGAYVPLLGGVGGEVTAPFANDVVAHFGGQNLALTTKFTLYIRSGWEIQCVPGSAMSPQLSLSPPHDETAIHTYFRVARELKDAYPADFNDLGKLWDVIKKVSSLLAPAVRGIPFAGPLLEAAGPGVGILGDRMIQLLKSSPSKKVSTTMSEAERARAAASLKAGESSKAPRKLAVARRARK